MKIGSICSGIEAASVAWSALGAKFAWFSEIAPFQVQFLHAKYPQVPNVGDLCAIPEKIANRTVEPVDVICGGTPCQAFSLTGHKRGLDDERGRLTLKFIEVVDANDEARGKPAIVFWENVEGVLKDKTNAFGCFVSGLAGCADVLPIAQWPNAGLVRGPRRNVAWRVLDAKYFGVPQQRKRLYVVAGGPGFKPENVLFEVHGGQLGKFPKAPLAFTKRGKQFEVFREYTDCLYSAYGTKWNGNAAAYNGSLYVSENGRLRRMTPLECERLMGFPDNYTDVDFASATNRYQSVGNSWAVPVVRWLGKRLFDAATLPDLNISSHHMALIFSHQRFADADYFGFNGEVVHLDDGSSINTTCIPETIVSSNIADIIDTDASEKVFISPVGCKGILRRAQERRMNICPRLAEVMKDIAAQLPEEEIERISRIQPRGAHSRRLEAAIAMS
ncbi:MAG: DNA cytosine methyltransferase [Fibrobacterales bacterium]|nr:DNA cytosine methyltransferase [Fibrobacterales bacterium]